MNPTAGLFMTVLAAATKAADILRFKNAFLERIYWDIQPIVAVPYQTLTVVIPTVNEGDVVDIGVGPIQPTDYAYNTAQLTLAMNLSASYIIKTWDQVRTPLMLREKFFGPKIEAFMRALNRRIIALLTPANFPNYALFTGTGTVAGQLTRQDISTAWQNLTGVGVPVDDLDNVSLMENHITFGQHLADTAFNQYLNVGERAAIDAQQRAVLAPMLGATPFYDQMLAPFNVGHQPAVLMHKYAICGVSADPPSLAGEGIMESTIEISGGVPLQIQVGKSLYDQGWVIHLHAMVGLAVIRPEYAILFQTAS